MNMNSMSKKRNEIHSMPYWYLRADSVMQIDDIGDGVGLLKVVRSRCGTCENKGIFIQTDEGIYTIGISTDIDECCERVVSLFTDEQMPLDIKQRLLNAKFRLLGKDFMEVIFNTCVEKGLMTVTVNGDTHSYSAVVKES